MIKTILKGIIIGAIIAIAISPLTVHAETAQERWIRIQKESNEEFMKGVEEDGNLTQEAIDALAWGDKSKKPNKKSKVKEKSTTTSSTRGDELNKGYVYSTDELHVVGLPEDERGYTKAGDYGKIEVDN